MLDRDHTIGHAYLIKGKNFNDLRRVISQQIIPLLQEYFYEDWHRIQLVLRDIKDGNEKNEPQFIQHNALVELDILGFDHEDYEDIVGPVAGQLSAMSNALAWEEAELKKLR